MRNRHLFGSLAALLIGSSVCLAQTTSTLPPPPPGSGALPTGAANPGLLAGLFSAGNGNGSGTPSTVTADPGPLAPFFAVLGGSNDYRAYGGLEYLLWRFKDAPLPVALVSTNFTSPNPTPAFGGQGYTAGWQSGYRMTLGTWIDSDHKLGVEASAVYFVPRSPTNFAMGSNNPNQVLAIPFNNVTPGGGTGGVFPGVIATNVNGQTAFLISGGAAVGTNNPTIGSIAVTSTTNLWGAELNGVLNLYRTDRIQLNVLGGFRYADLQESLNINALTSDPTLGPLASATFSDHFGTRNQFYSGQLGLKGEWSNGVFFVNATGKVALGVNEETVNVNGSFADSLPVFMNNFGVGPGGLLAQQSNIGQYNRGRFMVLPEAQLQAGLNLGRSVRIFAGYDFMYMSSVVRPGNQIDENINLSQVGPNGIHGPNLLVGPANPAMPFQSSTFWAQGVTFGLEFRY
jgi:hypothetical protein